MEKVRMRSTLRLDQAAHLLRRMAHLLDSFLQNQPKPQNLVTVGSLFSSKNPRSDPAKRQGAVRVNPPRILRPRPN
jgi:hypothetical protein